MSSSYLLKARQMGVTTEATRGARAITIYHPYALGDRQTKFQQVAGRKRLIEARFLGWASGSVEGPGIIGPAAEKAVYLHSLRAAAPAAGYRLPNPDAGQTAELFGQRVTGGPLDNAAHLYRGKPLAEFTVGIDVKSLRSQVRRTSSELYLASQHYASTCLASSCDLESASAREPKPPCGRR